MSANRVPHCDDCRAHFTELEAGTLPAPQQQEVQTHLAHCADCRHELARMQELFLLLDRQEAAPATLQPRLPAAVSDNVAVADAAASKQRRTAAAGATATTTTSFATLFQRYWPARPLWACAYSLLLLAGGVATGHWLPLDGTAASDGAALICPVASDPERWLPRPAPRSLA